MIFGVWYWRDGRDLLMGYDWCRMHKKLPHLPGKDEKSTASHIYLKTITVEPGKTKNPFKAMQLAYDSMQAEQWSPNGEAKILILKKGLTHTSMSVGDMLEDVTGTFWMVDNFGFIQIGKRV